MHLMAKMLHSFRVKMILNMGFSMLLSGTITFGIYKVLQYYYYHYVRWDDPLAALRTQIRNIGDIYFFLLLFIPMSILFFYLLTKRYSRYFKEISSGIHHLASGNYSYRVEIPSHDEFGNIAKDINLANEELQQAIEKGNIAESSKDQLVVNLAHDLRTPLTSVLGYLDLILKDERLTEEQVRHFTSIAFSKSQRLERLIDELFEITRLNYGTLTVEKKPIDLSELLYQLNEELYPLFEKSNLTARIQVADNLHILGDGDLLARVFENLLTNAIRYGSDGHYIDVNGYREDGYVIVEVINYGGTIPEEELPYLFDMFYKGDKARTHQEGSTGLGLFIAKNIVEQHDGVIQAQSNLIRTLFEVRLPQKEG